MNNKLPAHYYEFLNLSLFHFRYFLTLEEFLRRLLKMTEMRLLNPERV